MIHTIDSFPGRTILVNGKHQLYFGGTSYLGLQLHEKFQDIFIANIKKYGTNYGASRSANIQISVFNKAEKYLANLVESEACVTLSSGYLAGQLVAQSLNTTDFEFFYAPETHVAVQIPDKKTFQNFKSLNDALEKHLKNKNSTPVIFMDALTASGNGYPLFECLKELPLKDVILVVDDSHGIGIVEENGCGCYKILKALKPKELIVCCSLGKGFGIQAGAIFGTKDRIESFTQTDFFGGASPAAPTAFATLVEAESILIQQRQILHQNIELFLNSLKDRKQLQYVANYPAFYFSNKQLASYLAKNNVLITNFNYPNKDSPTMSRIVLSASHTKDDILILSKLLNNTKIR